MQSLNLKNAKWILSLSLITVLLLGTVGTVSASEFPDGEVIPAGETIDDDVFIGGENVVVDGTVNGMLFAGGTTITINGYVSGDALLMGETILISESAVIDGNLFIMGGDLVVNGTVTGSVFGGAADMNVGPTAVVGCNLYYGGFGVTLSKGSSIGKDLYAAGYQAVLSGDISRDLAFTGAAVELDGSVGRNATLDVGQVDESVRSQSYMYANPYLSRYIDTIIEPGIRVSDDAQVAGKLTYTSSQNVNTALESITSGMVVYQTPVPYEQQPNRHEYRGPVKDFDRRGLGSFLFGAAALNIARNFIKLMALGALALWLLSKPFRRLVDAAYTEPMKAIGWGFVIVAIGFLALFIVPLTFVLMGILVGFFSLGSLLGFWFGLLGLTLMLAFTLFFFVVFTVSKILAAYMFGRWLLKGLFKMEEEKPWLNLLVGVFLYVMIRAIPIIGFLAGFTATLIGAGAFWLVLFQKKAVEG
ncbi:MAG: polymer-forming cytoskeletal protein [Chloroflexi bacterium]|nr:polymer-forming cytoskeletal protein [Chloroflexota bacterium]